MTDPRPGTLLRLRRSGRLFIVRLGNNPDSVCVAPADRPDAPIVSLPPRQVLELFDVVKEAVRA